MLILFICFCRLVPGERIFSRFFHGSKWNTGSSLCRKQRQNGWCARGSAGDSNVTVAQAQCGLSIARKANLLLPHPPRLHSTRRSCVLQTETPGHLPNQKEPSRKTQVEDWNSLHSFPKHHGWGYLLTVLLSVLSVCSADTSAALLLREKLKVVLYFNSSLNQNYERIHTGQN